MRPDESFIQQPVRSLQTMLRVLSEQDRNHPTVVPDGIYGQTTANAVSSFQRMHGIPVTGITDQNTWDNIVAEYDRALIQVDRAEVLELILNPNEVLRRGDDSPYIYVVQALLTVLSEVYGSIPRPAATGILDAQTADSLAAFQQLSSLPMSGELDKITWKHLALHFPLAANLGQGQTQAESQRNAKPLRQST